MSKINPKAKIPSSNTRNQEYDVLGDILASITDLSDEKLEKLLSNYVKEPMDEITSTMTNSYLPTLTKISDNVALIAQMALSTVGALYGIKNITPSTLATQLLSKIDSVDLSKTIFKGLVNTIGNIQLIMESIDAKPTGTSSGTTTNINLDELIESIDGGFLMLDGSISTNIEQLSKSITSITDVQLDFLNTYIDTLKDIISDSSLKNLDLSVRSLIEPITTLSEKEIDTIPIKIETVLKAESAEMIKELSKLIDQDIQAKDFSAVGKSFADIIKATKGLSNADVKKLQTIATILGDENNGFFIMLKKTADMIKEHSKNINKNLEDGQKDMKKTITLSQELSDLFSALFSIANLDSKSYKNMVKNAKRVALTFARPKTGIMSLFNRYGEGAFYAILDNIQILSNDAKNIAPSVQSLKNIIESVVAIVNIEPELINRLDSNIIKISKVLTAPDNQPSISHILNTSNRIIKRINAEKFEKSAYDIRSGLRGFISAFDLSSTLFKVQASLFIFKFVREQIEDTLDEISSILKLAHKKLTGDKIYKPLELRKEVIIPFSELFILKSFTNVLKSAATGLVLIYIIQEMKSIIKLLQTVNGTQVNKAINTTNRFVNLSNSLNELIKNPTDSKSLFRYILSIMATKQLASHIKGMVHTLASINKKMIARAMANIDNIKELVDSLAVLKNSKENLDNLGKTFSRLTKINLQLALMTITAPVAWVGIQIMLRVVPKIQELAESIAGINYKGGATFTKKLDNLKNDIMAISKIMLIGGLVGTFMLPLIPGLLAFGFIFEKFGISIIEAIDNVAKSVKGKQKELKELASLVTTCGTVMIIGAAFMLIPGLFGNAMLFALSLGSFLLAVVASIRFGSMVGGRNVQVQLAGMGQLVLASAAVMMIGALFMKSGLVPQALQFGVVLGVFLLTIVAPLSLCARIAGNRGLKDMKAMGILIMMSAATMMVGAAFMLIPNMATAALKFAGTLGIFVLATVGTLALISALLGHRASKDAIGFGKLIITLSAVMLIGAAFMFIPEMAEKCMEFTWRLGLFILATVGIIALVSKIVTTKNFLLVGGIILLTILLGAAMITGAQILMDNPGLDKNIWIFMAMAGVLIVGMGAICFVAGLIAPEIGLGLLCMAGIIVIVWLMSKVMDTMANTIKNLGPENLSKMWEYIGIIGTVIGGLTAIVAVLGAIMATGVGAVGFALGAAALVSLIGIIDLIAVAMEHMALSMVYMNMAKGFDLNGAKKSITDFADLSLVVLDKFGTWDIVTKGKIVSKSIKALSEAIGSIATTVQQVASLVVPEFQEGKLIGFRTLNETDFRLAGENTQKIILTLGEAIIKIYKQAPEGMFESGGIFGLGSTPFDKVVKGSSGLGKMIATIAKGVKDVAELKIAEYDSTNGKVKGYRTLNETDFTNAATNVKTIISTLGNAIIQVYKDAPEGMFESEHWFTSSNPFGKVIKSATDMGKMISSIAKGVADFAGGKVPIKYNDKGEPIDYTTLKEIVADGTLAENIKSITTGLMEAIMQTYTSHPEVFSSLIIDSSGKRTYQGDYGKALETIVNVAQGSGEMLSSVAKGVIDIMSGRIPDEWDANNNPKHWVTIEDLFNKEDKKTNLTTLINNILTSVPGAIQELYNQSNGMFDKGWFGSDSPYDTIVKAIKASNEVLSSALDAFKTLQEAISGQNALNFDTLTASITSENIGLIPNTIHKAAFKDKKIKAAFNHDEKDYAKIAQTYKNIIPIFDAVSELYNKNREFLTNSTNLLLMNTNAKVLLFGENSLINQISNEINRDQVQFTKKVITYMATIQAVRLIVRQFESLYKDSEALFSTLDRLREGTSSVIAVFDIQAPGIDKVEPIFNAIQKINDGVKDAPDPTNFVQETKSAIDFIHTIDQVDVRKTNAMTDLLSAMKNSMDQSNSNRLQQMINQLVQVIAILSRELQETSLTFRRADENMKKRKEAIESTIRTLQTLIDKPMVVEVKESEVDHDSEDTGSASGGTPNRPSSSSSSGSSKSSSNAINDFTSLFSEIAAIIGNGDKGIKKV